MLGRYIHRALMTHPQVQVPGLTVPCLSLIGTVLCVVAVALGTMWHAAGLWFVSRSIVTGLYRKPGRPGWERYAAESIDTVQVTVLPVCLYLTECMTWGMTCVLLAGLYIHTCSCGYLASINSKRTHQSHYLSFPLIRSEELTVAYFLLMLLPSYSVFPIQGVIAVSVFSLLSVNVALDVYRSRGILAGKDGH